MKPGEFGDFFVKQMWVTMAFFGQLILPAAFLFGAIISAFRWGA